jgi:deoxyribodipyrimidine photo-lyase
LHAYGERADDLAGHMTSRLSPYLHFGCLSVVEVVSAVRGDPAADGFVRQLCWRDFHHQVTAAFPDIDRRDYRPRGDRWRDDPDGLVAWKDGRTGFPIVDAGMRQLRAEGWIHNRARLVVASFLVKDLRIDWREGAAHFLRWLVDGDVANNSGNWQWVAGTGNDTRPNRVLDPDRQARRHDPAGEYVRRYVPELAGLDGAVALRPWTLAPAERRRLDYPERLVDHDEARAEFLRRRG